MIIGQLLGSGGGIQPGSVVFFVVLLTVNETNFVGYTLNRVLDTGIGVGVALLINALIRPPEGTPPLRIKTLLKSRRREGQKADEEK